MQIDGNVITPDCWGNKQNAGSDALMGMSVDVLYADEYVTLLRSTIQIGDQIYLQYAAMGEGLNAE